MPSFSTSLKRTRKPHLGQQNRQDTRCRPVHAGMERLENRYLLSVAGFDHDHAGELEYHAEGTNWIDFSSRGHKKHADHVTWDPDPTSDGMVNLMVLVHNHGNLNANKLDRLNASVDEVNSAATTFGVDLHLNTTADPSTTHQIHLHEDTTSGCGGGALGCAEFAIFINHTGEFGDGHGNHLYAGEDTAGGTAEATLISGYDWYTGAESNSIGSSQFDYQTVATQELLHLVGLGHDSTVYSNDLEVAANSDQRSVMHGTLSEGIQRRLMSTHDQGLLVELYGPGQTSGGGGGGDDGGGKGPPPGKGRNKIVSASNAHAVQVLVPNVVDQAALQQMIADATSSESNENSTDRIDASHADEHLSSITTHEAPEHFDRRDSFSQPFDIDTPDLDDYFALLESDGEVGLSLGYWPIGL